MSSPIDVNEVAAATVALLDERETKSQARQREAKAQANTEAQRASQRALEMARAERRADELTLQTMEAHLGEIKAAIRAREELWKKFPIEIANLNCDLNRLLAQRQELRKKLGVA
jgi:chromosome segregation ATPase